ncbi:MAG: helix-hairpin-helix domain-containing protein, partial [Deltaproteobacteria bacterium]
MKNAQIAQVFNEIADLLELKGENPFRIRAYRRAALNVEGLAKDLGALPDAEIAELPGIGKDLAGKIRQHVATGRIDLHEELKKEIPAGLLEILRVPGVGPKTAKMLFDRRGVKSVDDLEVLARERKLAGLPGIKEKAEENIRKGIALLKRIGERQPLGKVLPLAREIVDRLRNEVPSGTFELGGSIRRCRDTIGDVDVLGAGKDPEAIFSAFVRLPVVGEVVEKGPTKCSVRTAEGIQVDLRVVERESFGAALQYF